MTSPRVPIVLTWVLLIAATASADTLSFQQGDGGAYSTTDATTIQLNATFPTDGSHTRVSVITHDMEALIRFPDIIGNSAGQIPSGAVINSATLTLTQAPAFDWKPSEIHQVFAAWDENTVTGAGFFAQPGPVGPIIGFLVMTDFWEPATGVLTSLVQEWANGNANQGILLRSPVPPDPFDWYITQFFSDDEPTAAYRPVLVVDFTPPAIAVQPTTWGSVKALYR